MCRGWPRTSAIDHGHQIHAVGARKSPRATRQRVRFASSAERLNNRSSGIEYRFGSTAFGQITGTNFGPRQMMLGSSNTSGETVAIAVLYEERRRVFFFRPGCRRNEWREITERRVPLCPLAHVLQASHNPVLLRVLRTPSAKRTRACMCCSDARGRSPTRRSVA